MNTCVLLTPVKICTKCKQEFPATAEYFYADKGYKKCGLKASCKKCDLARANVYQQTEGAKRYSTISGYLESVLKNMKYRCTNPKADNYKYYEGRGIKVCFKNAAEFIDYVTNVLQVDPRGLDIDRIDNSGNYERGNIRFVTHKENCQNRG